MSVAGGVGDAIVAASLCAGALGAGAGLRARAAARADRIALRLARARELAFADASRRLAQAARDGVDAVRDELARAARETAPVLDAVVMYEEHAGALTCVYAVGDRLAFFAGSRIALDDEAALPVRALVEGGRVTLAEPGIRPLHPADVAAIAFPLALGDGHACIVVACARVELGRATLDRLAMLADLAAPAYAIALERESDRRRAEYDGLTGLLTPRAFRQRLGWALERAARSPGARVALAFVDTDRFKEWNDSYGHASGDALLRELARLLRGAARGEDDLVARNGGDEFCLVFAGAGKADAIERAEHLRAQIAAADFSALHVPAARAVRISASIGVAAYPADADSASGLLERADAAMYHSKHTGRDGVSYVGVDGALARLVPVSA